MSSSRHWPSSRPSAMTSARKCYLAYRSGLVPRRLAMLGLIGGPLICATGIAVVLGWIDAGSTVQGIATIPEFLWELPLGIYLTVKGFTPSPVLT
jgi:hypothetical protein